MVENNNEIPATITEAYLLSRAYERITGVLRWQQHALLLHAYLEFKGFNLLALEEGQLGEPQEGVPADEVK